MKTTITKQVEEELLATFEVTCKLAHPLMKALPARTQPTATLERRPSAASGKSQDAAELSGDGDESEVVFTENGGLRFSATSPSTADSDSLVYSVDSEA